MIILGMPTDATSESLLLDSERAAVSNAVAKVASSLRDPIEEISETLESLEETVERPLVSLIGLMDNDSGTDEVDYLALADEVEKWLLEEEQARGTR